MACHQAWGISLAVLTLLQAIIIPVVNAAGAGGPAGVTSLNQGWLFGGEYIPGSETPAFDDTDFQQITIPHTVTPLGWDNYYNTEWNRIWIYRRHFDLPSSQNPTNGSVRTFLDFDSVLTVSTPIINGHILPTHEGGYLPFSYEITDYVNRTGNVLAVIVDARWSYVNPEGSSSGPASVDYLEPGGINRDVALRTVSSSFISDVFAKPVNVLNSTTRQVVVESTVDLAEAPGQINVISQLQDAGKILAQATGIWNISQSGNATVSLNISAPNVELWSPDSPKLYQVVTSLIARGREVHSFTRNIGFREAVFTTDGFFLNGARLQIFGLNRHQLFPYIGMSASERLQRHDAELLKELNVNMVRCSHYPQSPHFLDRCDELGIMVWEEVPGWNFIGNATWQQHVISDVQDMVIRDRSRPSIILWGVQVNESPREPALYTQTKALADTLDGSRQTSGSETSQSLTNWVGDVFAYDDYQSSDGNAKLAPPITTIPYLVTEAVGALDGPRFFRWIDDQHVQQDQAKLHAQVHDIAGSNKSYSGLLAWAGIDYDSLNGNIYENIKWPGVIDTFRVFKPGAAYYLAQGDPSNGARIEPAFYWYFGPVSPLTTLGANATIWSNVDILEAYIDGAHFATLNPDTANFPHTAHPPFYLDTTKVSASSYPELRLDGYVSGKKVTSRAFSGSTQGDHIQLTVNDNQLEADGIDSTLISFRSVDKYGNPRPYATGDVQVSIRGPGEWVNQLVALDVTAEPPVVFAGQSSNITATLKNGVFPWTENGGVGGAVIRTIAGHPGTIEIEVSHATLGQDSAQIHAVESPGSIVVSNTDSPSLSNTTLVLASAANWTPSSTDGVNLGNVQAGSKVSASWTVSPKAPGQSYQPPTVNASFSINNQPSQKILAVPVYAPITIDQARGNIGISNDSYTTIANFDGSKNSFSLQALAAAGLTPGSQFQAGGINFTWPNVTSGSPDNILAQGQTILVNATGTTLGFLGASVNAFNGGIGIIFYTDGSTSRFTLELGNYLDTQFLQNIAVVTTPYINTASGQNHQKTATLFYSGTPLSPQKTVLAVGLPSTNSALHIFSIAVT